MDKIILILTAICSFVYAHDPPKIIPNEHEWTVKAGDNVTFRCEHDQPLTWDMPKYIEFDGPELAMSEIYTFHNSGVSSPFVVKLKLYNVSAADVGFYTCYFNISYCMKFNTEELEINQNARRIYLYVDDPRTLLVPSDMIVNGYEDQTIIIPCRPSSPNVQVVLKIDDIEINPNKSMSWKANRTITYDSRVGFIINPSRMEDIDSNFECVARRDAAEETFFYMVALMRMFKSKTLDFDMFCLDEGVIYKLSIEDKLNGSFLSALHSN